MARLNRRLLRLSVIFASCTLSAAFAAGSPAAQNGLLGSREELGGGLHGLEELSRDRRWAVLPLDKREGNSTATSDPTPSDSLTPTPSDTATTTADTTAPMQETSTPSTSDKPTESPTPTPSTPPPVTPSSEGPTPPSTEETAQTSDGASSSPQQTLTVTGDGEDPGATTKTLVVKPTGDASGDDAETTAASQTTTGRRSLQTNGAGSRGPIYTLAIFPLLAGAFSL